MVARMMVKNGRSLRVLFVLLVAASAFTATTTTMVEAFVPLPNNMAVYRRLVAGVLPHQHSSLHVVKGDDDDDGVMGDPRNRIEDISIAAQAAASWSRVEPPNKVGDNLLFTDSGASGGFSMSPNDESTAYYSSSPRSTLYGYQQGTQQPPQMSAATTGNEAASAAQPETSTREPQQQQQQPIFNKEVSPLQSGNENWAQAKALLGDDKMMSATMSSSGSSRNFQGNSIWNEGLRLSQLPASGDAGMHLDPRDRIERLSIGDGESSSSSSTADSLLARSTAYKTTSSSSSPYVKGIDNISIWNEGLQLAELSSPGESGVALESHDRIERLSISNYEGSTTSDSLLARSTPYKTSSAYKSDRVENVSIWNEGLQLSELPSPGDSGVALESHDRIDRLSIGGNEGSTTSDSLLARSTPYKASSAYTSDRVENVSIWNEGLQLSELPSSGDSGVTLESHDRMVRLSINDGGERSSFTTDSLLARSSPYKRSSSYTSDRVENISIWNEGLEWAELPSSGDSGVTMESRSRMESVSIENQAIAARPSRTQGNPTAEPATTSPTPPTPAAPSVSSSSSAAAASPFYNKDVSPLAGPENWAHAKALLDDKSRIDGVSVWNEGLKLSKLPTTGDSGVKLDPRGRIESFSISDQTPPSSVAPIAAQGLDAENDVLEPGVKADPSKRLQGMSILQQAAAASSPTRRNEPVKPTEDSASVPSTTAEERVAKNADSPPKDFDKKMSNVEGLLDAVQELASESSELTEKEKTFLSSLKKVVGETDQQPPTKPPTSAAEPVAAGEKKKGGSKNSAFAELVEAARKRASENKADDSPSTTPAKPMTAEVADPTIAKDLVETESSKIAKGDSDEGEASGTSKPSSESSPDDEYFARPPGQGYW